MIIVDIDGCVLDNRRFPTFREWREAIPILEPNQPLIDILTPSLPSILFMTGRGEEVRDITIAWFQDHWPLAIERCIGFRFRPAGDMRPSEDVKRDMMHQLAAAGYPKPVMAIDDVTANIEMFKEFGIITMHHLLPGATYRDLKPLSEDDL